MMTMIKEHTMSNEQEAYKQQAAEHALRLVQSGMRLGLGTGSTANHFLRGLAARLNTGDLHDIVGVPTSEATALLAGQLGIPLTSLDLQPALDIAFDGADEIDPQLRLIKGLGGALLREKIVAVAARQFVVIGDISKRVVQLGERTPVPVEVIPFGVTPVTWRLSQLGATPTLRHNATGTLFCTDSQNLIVDCHFGPISDPEALAAAIKALPGVVDHGLFLGIATRCIVAGPAGIEMIG